MLFSRLLAVTMLISFCAGNLAAQSDQTSLSSESLSLESVSSESDQVRISPYPQLEFLSPDVGANANQDAFRPDGNFQVRPAEPAEYRQASDVYCYAIRSYRVVRDSPHSDTTHFGDYTTCVEASRLRVYSTIEHRR